MEDQIQPQGFTAMADAAHQFYRIERMEDPRITRDDKTDGGVLCSFSQTLGRRVRPEFQLTYDLLYTPGDFFIDGGDFVEDTRNRGDGYFCPSGDISYAYFLFNHVTIEMGKRLDKFYNIPHFKFDGFVFDIRGTDIPTNLNDFQSGYFI